MIIKTLFFNILQEQSKKIYFLSVWKKTCDKEFFTITDFKNRSEKIRYLPITKTPVKLLKNYRIIVEEDPKKIVIKKCNYSIWIASDGQTSTQVWQSTHMSLSTLALSFSMAIADAGHSLTQVSHPVHFALSTIATN